MPVNLRTESIDFYKTPSKANLKGVPFPEKTILFDHFLGDVLADQWAPSGDNGGTEAITVASGGTVTLTTSTADDDRSILASELNWKSSKNCGMFAKVKVDAITTVGMFIGFNDAKTEANDLLPFGYATATLTDTATDAVGWLFDTDATNDYWCMVNTKNGTDAVQETTTAPVAATYAVLGVTLDTSGNATFWYNGEAVGYKASAITTTVALTPFFGLISRAGSAARVMSVDYVLVYQDAE